MNMLPAIRQQLRFAFRSLETDRYGTQVVDVNFPANQPRGPTMPETIKLKPVGTL
jgi:hypothetical protein